MTFSLNDAHIAFHPKLQQGHLIKRYKRFLVDIALSDGSMTTVHCPNTGAMLGLMDFDDINPQRRVGFSKSPNLTRKYPHTLEMIEDQGVMVGINTQNPNRLIAHALELRVLPTLSDYTQIAQESYLNHTDTSKPRTRIDFALNTPGQPTCYVEVKNVHYKRNCTAYFPDSVTIRGQRHAQELGMLAQQGHRCLMLYVIQRPDVDAFEFADFIDPGYAKAAREAMDHGVEIMAVTCNVGVDGIRLDRCIAF